MTAGVPQCRKSIVLGQYGDSRSVFTVPSPESGRQLTDTAFHSEAVIFQIPGQPFRSLALLEGCFRIIMYLAAQFLKLRGVAFYVLNDGIFYFPDIQTKRSSPDSESI